MTVLKIALGVFLGLAAFTILGTLVMLLARPL